MRLPESPPWRRRSTVRGERYRLWRVRGPVFPVVITRIPASSLKVKGEAGDE